MVSAPRPYCPEVPPEIRQAATLRELAHDDHTGQLIGSGLVAEAAKGQALAELMRLYEACRTGGRG